MLVLEKLRNYRHIKANAGEEKIPQIHFYWTTRQSIKEFLFCRGMTQSSHFQIDKEFP